MLAAINNVNEVLQDALTGLNALDQAALDEQMIEMDGTLIRVSSEPMPSWGSRWPSRMPARPHYDLPLYRYLGGRPRVPFQFR